jgi:hypothetical protein
MPQLMASISVNPAVRYWASAAPECPRPKLPKRGSGSATANRYMDTLIPRRDLEECERVRLIDALQTRWSGTPSPLVFGLYLNVIGCSRHSLNRVSGGEFFLRKGPANASILLAKLRTGTRGVAHGASSASVAG